MAPTQRVDVEPDGSLIWRDRCRHDRDPASVPSWGADVEVLRP